MSKEERKIGTVKFFNSSKGYGFITPEEGGNDLFVHFSEVTMDGYKTLDENQKVEFDVGTGDKGPIAIKVIPK